uniref:Uncharacterized protein n=1 Tax=Anguilla anguilla TaxID=7936 RepID=A0A0E9VXL4_ANGAN
MFLSLWKTCSHTVHAWPGGKICFHFRQRTRLSNYALPASTLRS